VFVPGKPFLHILTFTSKAGANPSGDKKFYNISTQPTHVTVMPKDKRRKPLKNDEAFEAEKASGAGTQI
jgi:hypothetical protein